MCLDTPIPWYICSKQTPSIKYFHIDIQCTRTVRTEWVLVQISKSPCVVQSSKLQSAMTEKFVKLGKNTDEVDEVVDYLVNENLHRAEVRQIYDNWADTFDEVSTRVVTEINGHGDKRFSELFKFN